MRYCRDCGAELTEEIHVCPMADNTPVVESAAQQRWSVMSIVAFPLSILLFILSTLFIIWYFTIGDIGFLLVGFLNMWWGIPASLVCLTLSIVAVCLVFKLKNRGKVFAIVGLVMNVASLCMSIVMFSYPFIILA